MFKVGDEVLIKGKVGAVDIERDGFPYWVFAPHGMGYWLSEEDITDKTYEKGLADAWELAKKILEMCGEKREEILGLGSYANILEFVAPEEALAKIQAYEKEKEIKVGDVVVIDDENFLVTKVTKTTPTITIDGMRADGDIICYSDRQFKKTGKHIDIESLLRQIGE